MPTSLKRAKRNAGPWSSLRILNPTSPIASKNIHAFLVTCISGWDDNYDETDKRAIIDSLPPQYRKYEMDGGGRLICPISVDFVLEDTYVKNAIPRFKNDVSEGFYEKGWQNQARKAVDERRDGKFDACLQEKVEQEFGSSTEEQQDDSNIDSCQIEADSSDGEWSASVARGKHKDRQQRKGSS